ncbi:MAG: EndoU domain-containing protein [Granulosicoccus sp.]|nr:EndoU domain-containing protein [Granulosicoccus sp.]
MLQKYKKFVPIVAVILIALGVNLDKFGIDLQQLAGQSAPTTSTTSSGNNSTAPESGSDLKLSHWSDTKPKINQWHVFEGEINRKDKPVGFHSRPGGRDPANARVVSIKSGPNNAGVYTATIAIRDGQQWKEKFSSFFPDSMSVSDVNKAILHAFKNSKNPSKQPWSGPSGLGFEIQGYTASRGDINTAFPVFVRGQ